MDLRKRPRIFPLLIPVLMELIGLIVSVKAPGNWTRTKGDFGFSFHKAVQTIGRSFLYGIIDMGTYWRERPLIYVGLLFMFLFRSNIKDSTAYVSLIYITSGQASDYKEQMKLQTKLMENDSISDVIVPFINDLQEPLMHMPVTDDYGKFTNWATAQLYGKNSVIAMERSKWIEEYGNRIEN